VFPSEDRLTFSVVSSGTIMGGIICDDVPLIHHAAALRDSR
jgi:hypothetical protein